MANLYYLKMLSKSTTPAYLLYLLLICCNTPSIAQKNNLDSVLIKIIESPVSPQNQKSQAPHSSYYLVKLKLGIKKEKLVNKGIPILRTLDQRLIIIQATQDKLSDPMYEQIWPVN